MLRNLTEGASFLQGHLDPCLARGPWQDCELHLALKALSLWGHLGFQGIWASRALRDFSDNPSPPNTAPYILYLWTYI